MESRIAALSASIGGFSGFWLEASVDLKSKYLICLSIPCNLLLLGSGRWALHSSLLSELEVFLNRSVRRNFKIKISEVKEEIMTNAEVRGGFFNIPTI